MENSPSQQRLAMIRAGNREDLSGELDDRTLQEEEESEFVLNNS